MVYFVGGYFTLHLYFSTAFPRLDEPFLESHQAVSCSHAYRISLTSSLRKDSEMFSIHKGLQPKTSIALQIFHK